MYTVALLDVTDMSASLRKKAELLLSENDKLRYKKFTHDNDAKLFLFGRYLTKCLIAHVSKRRPQDISILMNGITEKPYESKRLTEFSISHSGSLVAVAVSQRPVGVDVQIHDQYQSDLFEKFFTSVEKKYSRQSTNSFYQLWTSVESLAKITGLGFNEEIMNRIPEGDQRIRSYTFSNVKYYIQTLLQTNEATLTVCTSEKVIFKNDTTNIIAEDINGLKSMDLSLTFYSCVGNTESEV